MYKLVIRNELALLFREKNYVWAKYSLDKLQSQLEQGAEVLHFVRGQRYETISIPAFLVAQKLFHEFTNFDDMKLRIQHPWMQIYSNDIKWLKSIVKKVPDSCEELWEPSKSNMNLLEANTIISYNIKDYQYKVTLGNRTCPNFINWVDSNLDKIKIGHKTYDAIAHNDYTKGLYFYIRDEKVLNLINLIIGPAAQRIDKIVYQTKTDK